MKKHKSKLFSNTDSKVWLIYLAIIVTFFVVVFSLNFFYAHNTFKDSLKYGGFFALGAAIISLPEAVVILFYGNSDITNDTHSSLVKSDPWYM